MRAWLAIALFAASWLYGVSYYQASNMAVWAVLVAIGTALLWNANSLAVPRAEGSATVAVLCAGLLAGLLPFDSQLADFASFLPIALLALGLALSVASAPAQLAISSG